MQVSVNSREFFDRELKTNWERNGGPAQTRYFMSRIIVDLPDPIKAFVTDNALSVLDWGCALGDGVDALKRTFPKCAVAGMDISYEAIRRARQRYPDHEFIRSDAIDRDFDVIFTSNCLEHFVDPLQVIDSHLARCRKLYILLVPYKEYPLMTGHFSRFEISTFAKQLGTWTCICAHVLETNTRFWHGKQLLVVYASKDCLQELGGGPELLKFRITMDRNMTAPGHNASYEERLLAEGKKWGDHLKVEASGEWNAWLDHPLIAAHYHERALIDNLPWPQWACMHCGGPAERSLDLGCGAGGRSFAAYRLDATRSIEGLDISEERIAQAERVRRELEIPGAFRVADSNTSELPTGHYGLIFSCHSFHHFFQLEHIMEQVHRALEPSGLFVLEEFIGPTQFQWTDEQIALVRSLLQLVPERLRRFRWDKVKMLEGRPTPADVEAVSPFESIRSAEILPLFNKYFQIVAIRKLGGTIQHLLYNGIMHNFQPSDPDAACCVQTIMSVEDSLIDNGLLPSDFMLLIGRRKDAPA